VQQLVKRLVLAVLLAGVAAEMPAAAAPAPKAAWTVLVYLDADNDLEAPMMANLEQMLRVGGTPQVNVIVLAARSAEGEPDPRYTNRAIANIPNWTGTKLLQVQKGRLVELADWGRANLGDPAVLGRFLGTTLRDFPAQRTAVILGDHGMAWAGAAVSVSAHDQLSIDDIKKALGEVAQAGGPVDLIGFDACVMGNLEVAKSLAGTARYMVASEEIEPADGWNYAAFLGALVANPAMDGKTLGTTIIDSYRDWFARSPDHDKQEKAKAITLALIDLDKVPAVDKAVSALGSGSQALLARGGHAAWVHVAQARFEAEEYGRTGRKPAPPGSEVYDLAHLAQNLRAKAQDPASAAAADAVVAAVKQAVPYSIHGEARPHAGGLSIFFPPDDTTLSMRAKNFYYDNAFAQGWPWQALLDKYTSVEASDAERNRPKPAIDPLAASGRMLAGDGKVSIRSKVRADELAEASFVLAVNQGGTRVVMGSLPVDLNASGALNEKWDGNWFTISNNNVEMIAPVSEFEELNDEQDVYWATVPAQLRLHGTREWIDVDLNFIIDTGDDEDDEPADAAAHEQGDDENDDEDDDEGHEEDVSGDFIYAIAWTAQGPREIDLDEGDELRPVYETIDPAGKEGLVVSQDPAHVIHIGDLDDLKVTETRMPPGKYLVGFEVRDLADRHSEQFVEVELK
jgi:hypothetical protein